VALNQQIMTSGREDSKQFSLRWPESFWERAKIAALQQRVSLQKAATIGCANYLGIDPPEDLEADEADDSKAENKSKRKA
jgi:hypothetical protein